MKNASPHAKIRPAAAYVVTFIVVPRWNRNREPCCAMAAVLHCIICKGDKPLDAFTSRQQRTSPSYATIRVCILCQAAAKEERDAVKKQEVQARQETFTSFVSFSFADTQRLPDLVLLPSKLRVRLTVGGHSVSAPPPLENACAAPVRATTVQSLRAAGAVVPAGLANGAVVVLPCTPQQYKRATTTRQKRGKRFPLHFVRINGEEVQLKKGINVNTFKQGAEPVVAASQFDLTAMDQETRDARNAAEKLKGTVSSVWRDRDGAYAELKAFVVRKDWDGFLEACGRYVKEVKYQPGILAKGAHMAACMLGNCDGQIKEHLFGSQGTVRVAMKKATLQVGANVLQRAKNLEALFDETTPSDVVCAARLSQQGKPVDWRKGDVAHGRHSAFTKTWPPGVSVALTASGCRITACCGPNDMRSCDTIKQAADLAKMNPEIRKQIQGDEAMLADLEESLAVLGQSDARIAAAKTAGEDAAVRRVGDLPGRNGRKGMQAPLALVQASLDEATRQLRDVGLDLQASLPGADRRQWPLMLGGPVALPRDLRAEVKLAWKETMDRFGSEGPARVLEELDAALWRRGLYPKIFDAVGVDVRPAHCQAVVMKWYRVGSLLQDAVLESSIVIAPVTSVTQRRSYLRFGSTSMPSTRRL